ncbi:OmpA/MotB family protein [Clostridium uliginosum]|uniref:Chemotaxis protein MotB n=1 Tax=Clostridium uliginosum TaxID=119641 RepID=A0A1I1SF44_9CLOT|nr:flagellar motor protein MotB [Clostridium uliginosum]SFD45105.1 chemotaxis protein MotB [Clostridium uliginosum]
MKKKKQQPENSERWLLTYSDLITLLMVLFVILYASSNVDKNKYKQISTSFQQAFSIGGGKNINSSDGEAIENKIVTEESKVVTEEEKLEEVKAQVDKVIEGSELKGNISTSIQERGLIISFTDNVFFNSGDATIKEDYKKKLASISKVLNNIDNYIRVEGHTDSVAINTEKFHSNWQLSSVRAANVVEFLITDGKVEANRLSSVGYGECRPTQSNNTEEGKSANRRVDILILNSKFNKSEKAK